jgi:predicted DNA-binding transcriptional regulator AlpA
MDPVRILDLHTTLRASGKKKTGLYADIKSRLFVSAVRIGPGRKGWLEHEVDAVNRARAASWSDEQIRNLVEQLERSRGELARNLPTAQNQAPTAASAV